MASEITIRPMVASDAPRFAAAFAAQGWRGKDEAQFLSYVREQQEGRLNAFTALLEGEPAGYCLLLPEAAEGPFTGAGIPVIADFNVLIRFRRRGVGSRLMDAAEAEAFRRRDRVCLAVGLHEGYGPAQRLYARRGYLPDGSGVWRGNAVFPPYSASPVDDDLLLWLSRERPLGASREWALGIASRHLAASLGLSDGLPAEAVLCFRENAATPEPSLTLAAIGRTVIVSASPKVLPRAKALLQGRTREEIFECPWVYGLTIHYIPESRLPALPFPVGFAARVLEGEALLAAHDRIRFPNALSEDASTDRIAVCAVRGGEIVAMAAASEVAADLWEMGVDVAEDCRKGGLGAALVNRLARELLARGVLPLYSAASSNIASQATAHRAGLSPLWIESYRTALDGSAAFDNLIRKEGSG